MWSRPGGHISPPQSSSFSETSPFDRTSRSASSELDEFNTRSHQGRTGDQQERNHSSALYGRGISSISIHVLPSRDLTQNTGPIIFGPSWVSSDTYISPSFISAGLQMSPESRAYEPSRFHHRSQCESQRRHPYRLDESTHRKVFVSRVRDVEEMGPSRFSRKRNHRVTCVCTPYNDIQTHNLHENTVTERVETHVPTNHWIHTHENQQMFETDATSLLTSNHLSETDTRTINEIDDETPRSTYQSLRSSSSVSESDTNPLFSRNLAVQNVFNSDSNSPYHVSDTATSRITRNLEMDQNSFNMNSPICDLQDLRSSKNNDSEYSNHDRSSEEFSARSFSSGINPNSSPITPYRLCSLSLLSVPPPTAHARQVANRVVKHARYNKTPNESSMWCPNCGLFPELPVTGQCGHTRCTKCIQDHGSCPCGTQAPKNLHVNTLIQDLIRKLLPSHHASASMAANENDGMVQGKHGSAGDCRRISHPSIMSLRLVARSSCVRRLPAYSCQRTLFSPAARLAVTNVPPHTPMSPQSRFKHARELLALGRYRDAAPHLARVAASTEIALARLARSLLIQTITVLSRNCDLRRLTRELYRSVRQQSAATWLKPADLECVLCYHTYTMPVTTPCGHTYCRTCIERSMDYKKTCALCLRSLDDFNLAATRETVFIRAALASIDALSSPSPPDPDVIPIFVCTVAYPAIPCPLFIFDPRYWLMIRRVLESGSRKFGMVAYERDRTYSDYGTVLEVCDCVHLEDGRSILSTVGVSRFKVIDRDVKDGCDVARIQPLTDITPTEELVIWDLRIMATQILYKALLWLNRMSRTFRSEIETAFGQLPHFDYRDEDWWESSDGPAWLWWLIAILPLRSEIKVLILSTKNLLKRMMAVSRTLEAIDRVDLTANGNSECVLQSALTNTEDWLERSA